MHQGFVSLLASVRCLCTFGSSFVRFSYNPDTIKAVRSDLYIYGTGALRILVILVGWYDVNETAET